MAHSKVSPSASPEHLPTTDPPSNNPRVAEEISIPLQDKRDISNGDGNVDKEAKSPERKTSQREPKQSERPRRKPSDNKHKSPTREGGSPDKRAPASPNPMDQTWPEIVKAALRTNQPSTTKSTFFNSVNVFAVCVGFLYMLHGMQIQYNNMATPHFARRYPIDAKEVEFIHGVEVMAVLICLLLVAYFGNRFHRPIAIALGAFLSAAGLLIKTTAYFKYGTLPYEDMTISAFLDSELCPSNMRNISVNNPCEALKALEEPFSLPFSLACFGQFLVGVGVSLYASLGLVHIEENAKPNRATILIGLCLSMHGLGQFIGTYLGGGLMSLPEDITGPRYYLSEVERVGAWWLGYLVISAGLVILTALFTCFPIWFTEPEWLTSRKERLKKKLLEGRIKRRISEKKNSTKGQYEKNTRKSSDAKRPPDKDKSKKKKVPTATLR